jgi:hypothetical protein
MPRKVGPNEILIEDVEPDLLRAIERSALLSARTVEEEARVLLERGWALVQAEAAPKG